MDRTDIHKACATGDLAVVFECVEGRRCNVNEVDKRGLSPLHVSARFGHAHIIEYLLSQGANPHLQDPQGRTPAEHARTPEVQAAFPPAVRPPQQLGAPPRQAPNVYVPSNPPQIGHSQPMAAPPPPLIVRQQPHQQPHPAHPASSAPPAYYGHAAPPPQRYYQGQQQHPAVDPRVYAAPAHAAPPRYYPTEAVYDQMPAYGAQPMPMPMAYAQPHAYPPQGHRAPQQQPAYHPQMASRQGAPPQGGYNPGRAAPRGYTQPGEYVAL